LVGLELDSAAPWWVGAGAGGKVVPGTTRRTESQKPTAKLKKNVTAAKLTLSMEPVNPTAIGFSLIGKINS
jgi:hypothetical protein